MPPKNSSTGRRLPLGDSSITSCSSNVSLLSISFLLNELTSQYRSLLQCNTDRYQPGLSQVSVLKYRCEFGLVQAVTDPGDGQDQAGTAGIRFDLLAQPPDLDVDDPLTFGTRIVSPNILDDLGASQHLAWVAGKVHQQAKFCGRQGDLVFAAQHLAATQIDGQVSCIDCFAASGGQLPVGPAQQ